MSHNQSRADKSDAQLRKPGRSGSGSSGHYKGFSGGGGGKGGSGGGPAPPAPPSSSSSFVSSNPSNQPSLSSNRSFKKSGNVHGGHSRVNPTSTVSEVGAAPSAPFSRGVQNGTHTQRLLQGASNAPTPSGTKPVEVSAPRTSKPLPRPPLSQSSAGVLDSNAPMTPAKGEASGSFTLQFGSISPGFMNGMQIPARTSSAPPNLDEQKRDQARHDSFRAAPTLPIPSVPKQQQQQQPRKDVVSLSQQNAGNSQTPPQAKRENNAQIPIPPAMGAQKPSGSGIPVAGMALPSFQHPQVSVQFGGPSPQGVTGGSLQMPMVQIPISNAQQVQQQMYISGIQPHVMQPQGMIHQGQGVNFAPQMGHQLAPQMGYLGMGIATQYTQQQPNKYSGPRKTTVKITDPETHEELRLDKRVDSHPDSSGQRSHVNLPPQSQPMPPFAPGHQISYYPPLQSSPYVSSSVYFPVQSSLSLTSPQLTTGSQGPRFNYSIGQSGPSVSVMNPSVLNTLPSSKSGPSTHVKSEPPKSGHSQDGHALPVSVSPATVHVTMRRAGSVSAEKTGVTSATAGVLIHKDEASKAVGPPGETAASLQQKASESRGENSAEKHKPAPEPLETVKKDSADRHSVVVSSFDSIQRTQPDVSSSAPTTPVVSVSSSMDNQRRDPIKRSDSLKDCQRRPSKEDLRHSQQLQKAEVSGTTSGSSVHSLKISEEISASALNAKEALQNSVNTQVHPRPSESSSSFHSQEKEALSDYSRVSREKEALPDVCAGFSDASALSTGFVPPREPETMESVSSSSLVGDATCPDAASQKQDNFDLAAELKQDVELGESEKPQAIDDTSKDTCSSKICSVSIVPESSQVTNQTRQLEDGTAPNNSDRGTLDNSDDAENRFPGPEEEAGPTSEDNRTVVEIDKAITDSTDSTCAEVDTSSNLSSYESKPFIPDAYECRAETISCQGAFSAESSKPTPERELASVLDSSDMTGKLEEKAAEVFTSGHVSNPSSGFKDKPLAEGTRLKTAPAKKKKKKEIYSKADAAGTNSDLYMAYKSPKEKTEVVIATESIDSSSEVDVIHVPTDDTENEVVANEEDGQSKTELDDWEDAADISTPKLTTSETLQKGSGVMKLDDSKSGAMGKKYSRDFLLTFADQCTDLPVGFEIGSNIADAVMNVQGGFGHPVDRKQFPSPARIIDRPSSANRLDRRVVGAMDDDKWTKSSNNFSIRDLPSEVVHGAPGISFRHGQGVNHGVLRNPRGQSNQYTGGILAAGPPSTQGGMARGNLEADRWQRAPGNQRGLIPSPQTPLQVMHKAEKKYEVGRVSDKEEAKQRQLKAILNKLTPQNFDRLFEQVKEVNIDNTVTLTGVISQIFDKALTEPTFCEMYANFCLHLSGALPDFNEDNEKITFKRLLLNKCQEEFERGEREEAEANRAEEEGEMKQTVEQREGKKLQARRRMLGNIRLIGELYKKRMLTERIMHECIKKLLGQYQNPDEEDIEALCKLMSTIGVMIDHQKAKEHMDAYFDTMTKLSTNQKLSSRVRFMLKDAIDLRKNKWQQRRKVEGPKKIEEVHRDAVQERQAQSSRLSRGPGMSSSSRRAPPVDYGPRGSTFLPSPGSHQIGALRNFSPQVRGPGTQDVRMEDRHPSESRTLSVPLPQRPGNDDSITLGPQGGLARGMSVRGQPLMLTPLADITPTSGEPRRIASGPNGYSFDRPLYSSREELTPRYSADRLMGSSDQSYSLQNRGSRDLGNADLTIGRSLSSTSGSQNVSSEANSLSEERLREKSISAIREYYSAKDEKEVALCVSELNSPSFYPSMVSLWVTDSFERKDIERDLLSRLLINLCKSQDSVLGQVELIEGFESVLSSLEDAVNDAPKAAEFLGRIFAKTILENAIPYREIGRLIHEGGEEPGRLVEIGLAADVLGSILEIIRTEKGESVLNEICSNSNLRLEDFMPPQPLKSRKLDPFL